MNIIPIVTVNDLAKDSFTTAKSGIDLKLSKASGNGLKLTEDGLTYTAQGGANKFPRTLIAVLASSESTKVNFNNELDFSFLFQDLGSDGDYLKWGVDSNYQMRVSPYRHQDDNNYAAESNGVDFTTQISMRYWDRPAHQMNISYRVDDVMRTLMLSHVYLDGKFFIWADVICDEPTSFIWDGDNNGGSDPGPNPGPNPGGVSANLDGGLYNNIYLLDIINSKYVLLEGISEYSDNGYPDTLLMRILPDGSVDTEVAMGWYGSDSNPNSIRYHYHAGSDTLSISHNSGAGLEIYSDNTMFLVDTGRNSEYAQVTTYVDDNTGELLIAVAYGDLNVVDFYRYADGEAVFERSWNMDLNSGNEDSNMVWYNGVVVVNSSQLLTLHQLVVNGQSTNRLVLRNPSDGTIIATKEISNSTTGVFVPDTNLVLDAGKNTSGEAVVQLWEVTSTGFELITESVLFDGTSEYLSIVGRKLPADPELEGPNGKPGVIISTWLDNQFAIVTPYYVEGSGYTLEVLQFVSDRIMGDVGTIGGFEAVLTPGASWGEAMIMELSTELTSTKIGLTPFVNNEVA